MPKSRSSIAPDARVFHTLDLLRGFAAICVVAFHMGATFAPGGYLAVDLFFMMSGVVLSHAYEARFRAGMGTIDFMRLRFIRLYPLYLLGTLFGIAVTVASLLGRNSVHWDAVSLLRAALLQLFFLPNLATSPVDSLFPLNIPCWSLFLEILINLLFVMCWRWLSSRRLVALCLLAAGVVAWGVVQVGNMDQGSTVATFAIGFARTVFGFFVGVLIARHIPRVQKAASNLIVLAVTASVGIAIAGSPHADLRVAWDVACVLLVFPVVVYFATLVNPDARLTGVATFLGVTSYAVYVLHSPLTSVLNSMSRHLGGGGQGTSIVVLAGLLVVLLAGCWVVDRIIDAPVRRYLARVIPRMRKSSTG
ncbi:MAG: acyltransferase [Pseudomonadota bacterium]